MTAQTSDFVWYELLTEDTDGAQSFYTGLLGWEIKSMNQPGMDYQAFTMKGTDVSGLMAITDDMRSQNVRPHWAGLGWR